MRVEDGPINIFIFFSILVPKFLVIMDEKDDDGPCVCFGLIRFLFRRALI